MNTTKTALAYGDDFFGELTFAEMLEIQNRHSNSSDTIITHINSYLQSSEAA